MKKLAIIISVYKNDDIDCFNDCIESIKNQTFIDFNVFIQFDGIVDTKIDNYCNTLISKDNRFKIYKRAINKGLAFSLNELLEFVLSNGYTYIARMDADDVCFIDRFEKQVLFLDENIEIDIVGGYIEEFDNGKFKKIVKYPLRHIDMKAFFGKRNPLAHGTVMFRNSFFEKAGKYPETTNADEDTLLWLNGFLSGCIFANIPHTLVHVRVSDDFYRRRSGIKKSVSDFANRCKVIKLLNLPPITYIYAYMRFAFSIIHFPAFTKIIYRIFRS